MPSELDSVSSILEDSTNEDLDNIPVSDNGKAGFDIGAVMEHFAQPHDVVILSALLKDRYSSIALARLTPNDKRYLWANRFVEKHVEARLRNKATYYDIHRALLKDEALAVAISKGTLGGLVDLVLAKRTQPLGMPGQMQLPYEDRVVDDQDRRSGLQQGLSSERR